MLFFRSRRRLAIAILGLVVLAPGSLCAEETNGLVTESILNSSTIEAVSEEPLRLGPPRATPDSPVKRWTLSDSDFSAARPSFTGAFTFVAFGLGPGFAFD